MRVQNGRITDHWGVRNLLSLMQQIGGWTPPASDAISRDVGTHRRLPPASIPSSSAGADTCMKPTEITHAQPVLARENAGNVLTVLDDQFTVKLTTQQTQGAFTLLEVITPPGDGPPPHYHVNADELFMLQEGRVSYFIQNRWTELGPGGVVFVPRRSIHTFRNVGDVPARQLGLVMP
jgi:mannose-6-phosphate isomerase-like protein (cupin superfamily)